MLYKTVNTNYYLHTPYPQYQIGITNQNNFKPSDTFQFKMV